MTDVEVATARFCAWDLIIRPDSVLEFARLGDGVARNRRQDTPNTFFVFAIRYFLIFSQLQRSRQSQLVNFKNENTASTKIRCWVVFKKKVKFINAGKHRKVSRVRLRPVRVRLELFISILY